MDGSNGSSELEKEVFWMKVGSKFEDFAKIRKSLRLIRYSYQEQHQPVNPIGPARDDLDPQLDQKPYLVIFNRPAPAISDTIRASPARSVDDTSVMLPSILHTDAFSALTYIPTR